MNALSFWLQLLLVDIYLISFGLSSASDDNTHHEGAAAKVADDNAQSNQGRLNGGPTGIRTISRSEKANYTEFLPCLDATPSSLRPFTQEWRSKTREPLYSSLPCAPERCFRSVQDGYEHFLSLSLEEMANEVEQMMYQHGFVSAPIVSSIRRQQTFSGNSRAWQPGSNPYEQFHMDYFEVPAYVVTGILYAEPSQDLQGGETCLADSFTRSTATSDDFALKEGLMIEPKKGRLTLFSGGGENFHGPMPIHRRDQQRPSYILFFKCKEEVDEATMDNSKAEL